GQLAAGIGRASSWGNLFALSSEYAFFRSPTWQAAVRYDGYQTLNYNNHEFDYSDHVVGARFTRTDLLPSGQRYFVPLRPFYAILLQAGRRFLQRPTGLMDSYLFWDSSGANRTQLFYQLEGKIFNEHPSGSFQPLGKRSEDRDALNYRVGLVHYMYFDHQRHGISFGYNYDFDDTEGKNWTYAGHRAVAGLLVTLPWDIRATTNFEYHARHYNGRNNRRFREQRSENESIALFSLAKDITPNLTLTFENLWDSNGSTIADFAYRRQVTSLGLTWRYY